MEGARKWRGRPKIPQIKVMRKDRKKLLVTAEMALNLTGMPYPISSCMCEIALGVSDAGKNKKII